MKTYLALTSALFALLTIVHVWRAIVEPSVRNPWFLLITAVSAVLCLWALRLWRRAARN
ncbi:MAG: hypothetical protein ABJF01_11615 [bacterium]